MRDLALPLCFRSPTRTSSHVCSGLLTCERAASFIWQPLLPRTILTSIIPCPSPPASQQHYWEEYLLTRPVLGPLLLWAVTDFNFSENRWVQSQTVWEKLSFLLIFPPVFLSFTFILLPHTYNTSDTRYMGFLFPTTSDSATPAGSPTI